MKCEALSITNKHSPVSFDNWFFPSCLEALSDFVISSNLKWNDHCQQILHRATQSREELCMAALTTKAAAYLRPCLMLYGLFTLHEDYQYTI